MANIEFHTWAELGPETAFRAEDGWSLHLTGLAPYAEHTGSDGRVRRYALPAQVAALARAAQAAADAAWQDRLMRAACIT